MPTNNLFGIKIIEGSRVSVNYCIFLLELIDTFMDLRGHLEKIVFLMDNAAIHHSILVEKQGR